MGIRVSEIAYQSMFGLTPCEKRALIVAERRRKASKRMRKPHDEFASTRTLMANYFDDSKSVVLGRS